MKSSVNIQFVFVCILYVYFIGAEELCIFGWSGFGLFSRSLIPPLYLWVDPFLHLAFPSNAGVQPLHRADCPELCMCAY